MDDKKLNKCSTTGGGSSEPQSDVYSSTECHLEESNVAIPTDEAVAEAKEWVDDENRR